VNLSSNGKNQSKFWIWDAGIQSCLRNSMTRASKISTILTSLLSALNKCKKEILWEDLNWNGKSWMWETCVSRMTFSIWLLTSQPSMLYYVANVHSWTLHLWWKNVSEFLKLMAHTWVYHTAPLKIDYCTTRDLIWKWLYRPFKLPLLGKTPRKRACIMYTCVRSLRVLTLNARKIGLQWRHR
jgi:hypothetical protein